MPTADDARRRLLDAILPVASDLSLPLVLRRIVESATELVGARYGALGVLGADRTLSDFLTVGIDAAAHARIGRLPEGQGILGLLILEPVPIRLPDLTQHPDSFGFPAHHPPMHSFLGVPVKVRDSIFGNLYMTEKIGADEFTQEDEDLLVGLAATAGVAIENARLAGRVRELALLEDRERIARDLHDTVIQRLFAVGMQLQGTARLTDKPEVAARLNQAVDDLDRTVRDIRSTIFSLHASGNDAGSLRALIQIIGHEVVDALGFHPTIFFEGPVDSTVPDEVAEQLQAVVREALSNVAKHAKASRVVVRVAAADGVVSLSVVDDGVGRPPAAEGPGNGLANMASRAERLGGSFVVGAGEDGGTTLRWSVPLSN
ncbi:MAG: sensor histidine kinase [Mycobacteriales bacterium]